MCRLHNAWAAQVLYAAGGADASRSLGKILKAFMSNWVDFIAYALVLCMIIWGLWHWRAFGRDRRQPRGEVRRHQEQYFAYDEERNRGGDVAAIELTFEVPKERRFFLRKEGIFDRVSKGIRLTSEQQAADQAFDSQYFVDTQDGAFMQLLRERKDIRGNLVLLLKRMKALRAGFHSITCDNGLLRIRLGVLFVERRDRVESEVVVWLTPLLDALRQLPVDLSRRSNNKYSQADLPYRLALMFLLVGLISMVYLLTLTADRLLEPWAFFDFSLLVACVPIALFLLWAQHRVSYIANRHRWIFVWLLVATPGLIMLSFAILRIGNMAFDVASAKRVAVTDAQIATRYNGRGGGDTKTLTYTSNHPALRNWHGIIDRKTYDRLLLAWGGKRSPRATVLLHPGALGFAWAEIEPY